MEKIQLHLFGSLKTVHLGINSARFFSVRRTVTGFYITRFLKCLLWPKTFHDFFFFLRAHEYILPQYAHVSSLHVIYSASFLCIMTRITNRVSGNTVSHISLKCPEPKISGTCITNGKYWCLAQRTCNGIFVGIEVLLQKGFFFFAEEVEACFCIIPSLHWSDMSVS